MTLRWELYVVPVSLLIGTAILLHGLRASRMVWLLFVSACAFAGYSGFVEQRDFDATCKTETQKHHSNPVSPLRPARVVGLDEGMAFIAGREALKRPGLTAVEVRNYDKAGLPVERLERSGLDFTWTPVSDPGPDYRLRETQQAVQSPGGHSYYRLHFVLYEPDGRVLAQRVHLNWRWNWKDVVHYWLLKRSWESCGDSFYVFDELLDLVSERPHK